MQICKGVPLAEISQTIMRNSGNFNKKYFKSKWVPSCTSFEIIDCEVISWQVVTFDEFICENNMHRGKLLQYYYNI